MIINYTTSKTKTDLEIQFYKDVEFCKLEDNLNIVICSIEENTLPKVEKIFPVFHLNIFKSVFDMLSMFGTYIKNLEDIECVFIRDSHLLNCEQISAIQTASKIFGFNINFYGLELHTPAVRKLKAISKNVFVAPYDSFTKHYYDENKLYA